MQLTPGEKTTITTYNQQAESYAFDHVASGFWSEEMARLKELLPTGKILEVGSGAGRDAKELIEAGYEYFGTDASAGMLAQARKNNPGVFFEEMNVCDLPYEDSFDGFWCAAVLVHIPREKIDIALSAIHRSMKPGAFGFIATKKGEGEGLEPDGPGIQGADRLFVYYSNEDFSEILAANGFTVVEQGYRPVSERSKWLTYIVEVRDRDD